MYLVLPLMPIMYLVLPLMLQDHAGAQKEARGKGKLKVARGGAASDIGHW
jgi:hypothetical protein